MKRLLLLPLMVLGLACEPAINPPPVPPPVTYVFKEIFWSSAVDVNATPPRREPHSCAIRVSPAEATLHAQYETVDTFWNANGWAFMVACVFPARSLGFALPVVKAGPCGNEQGPVVLRFHLDSAPIFGIGSGHYDSLSATNFAVWCKAYVEATG